MEQEKKKSKKRGSSIIFTLLNLILSLILTVTLILTVMENRRTVTTMATTIETQQQQLEAELAKESIPMETFREQAQKFNVSAEFLQSFFDDRIVYKDTEGIVYAPIDESLPKNTYDFSQLVKVNGRYEYRVNGQKTGAVGIDVSKYQGTVDWEKVKADGIDFAILRLGYRGYGTGKLMLDEQFEENIQNALKVGMKVGVYFFSQAVSEEEAREETQMVIDNLKDYSITYPVVLDIEDVPEASRTSEMTVEETTDMAIAFCETVRDAGYTPMLYANTKWFLARLDLSRLTDCQKWLAQYYTTPFFPYELQMWQYTGSGKVDGITGNVDLNVCFAEY